MERDFLNKNKNSIEQSIGQPLNKYLHKDLVFDTGDTNVEFDMEIVEDIMTNQVYDIVDYTKRSDVYTDVGTRITVGRIGNVCVQFLIQPSRAIPAAKAMSVRPTVD